MISRGVYITMQSQITTGTMEGSFTQWHIVPSSALTASATTASGFGVFSEFSTASYCFVGEHLIESAPRCVEYVFGKIALDHILYVQSFATDDLVFLRQGMGEFVKEVSSLIIDLQVLTSEFDTRLLTIPAPLDSFAMDSLQSSEFPLSVKIEFGVGDVLSFVVGQETFKSNINTDLLGGSVLHNWQVEFTTEDCEPLTRLVAFNSESLNLSLRNTMQDDGYATYFTKSKSFVAEEFESALREGDASDSAFESGETSFDFDSFFSQFDSVEEVRECFAESVADILEDLTMNILQSGVAYFEVKNETIEVEFLGQPEGLIQPEEFVIDKFTMREYFEKSDFLFGGRIQPVGVHPEFHRGEKI